MSNDPDDERTDGVNGAESPEADDPFAELDEDGDGDPFAELEEVELEDDPYGELTDSGDDDLFTEVAVDEIDEESVWEDLAQADAATDRAISGDLPDVETKPDEQIVPKRGYCEKCEHFSGPPETSCSNPGTEIRELVDMKHFRVANCPVVARRRGLNQSSDD